MTRRRAILLAVVALVGQLAAVVPVAAARQGVEGDTYVSPTFGWSISWDETWTVDDEGTEDGIDSLTLTDPLNIVYFEAYEGHGGDVDACIEDVLANLEDEDAFED